MSCGGIGRGINLRDLCRQHVEPHSECGNRLSGKGEGGSRFCGVDHCHSECRRVSRSIADLLRLSNDVNPVTISVNPTSIILSQQATLTWTSPGADSCTASGAWSGPEQTSGSTVETPITAGALTYTLTCSNSGGSTTSSAVLTVNAPAAGKTIFNYDPNGSLMSDGVFNYIYDAANRLNQAERIPVGTTTATVLSSYTANGLNQRVMMMTGTTAPVTVSLLAYDEAGHLIGHYVNVAKVADASETVWLGDMPVAIVKPANTFYIHSDHLNTPRQISNTNQDPVWAWVCKLTGVAQDIAEVRSRVRRIRVGCIGTIRSRALGTTTLETMIRALADTSNPIQLD